MFFFNFTLGIWQVEIYHHFFSALNDLETFLHPHNVSPVRLDVNNEEIMIFLKLFCYSIQTKLFYLVIAR